MKLDILGATNFVNRMFAACGKFQWARELWKNGQEAGATRLEFGIEWEAVEKLGQYRRTVVDNGCGMSSDELLNFFSKLGEGGKKIGGVHDNFGVGAKIATLPWNPNGLVVISYKDAVASMIWVELNADTQDYELREYDVDGKAACVIDPHEIEWGEGDVDWSALRPAWLEEHGTIVVLLGSDDAPHTVLGNPEADESGNKALSQYLNRRIWDLSGMQVVVHELRGNEACNWPTSREDKDNQRRPNRRVIEGASYYLTDLKAKDGKLNESDVIALDKGRVAAEYYLWEGKRPEVRNYAMMGGYIAIRYKGELFQLRNSKPHFRMFGVIENKVQENLTIILEPQLYAAGAEAWGIHSDQSRSRIIFSGDGEKGVEVPFSDWGLEFTENMPDAIAEAIRVARGDDAAEMTDDAYRKRLQNKFGDRWSVKRKVVAEVDDKTTDTGAASNDELDVNATPTPERPHSERKHKKRHKVKRRLGKDGNGTNLTELEQPVDVPRYAFGRKGDFEKEYHLALWAPRGREVPTVVLNIEAPILEDLVTHHQEQYPAVHAEEVARTIRQVFGEVAACKVAHSEQLTRHGVPVEEIDRTYRTEAALTLALMGLIAEESLIKQRLLKFGRKAKTRAALRSHYGRASAPSVARPTDPSEPSVVL